MKIKKVKIIITDLHKYSLVAYLVDNEDFLKEITDIREEVLDKNKFYPREIFDTAKSIEKNCNLNIKKNYEDFRSYKNPLVRELLDSIDLYWSDENWEIPTLLRKFHKPKSLYKDVVDAAIFTNKVYTQDFNDEPMIYEQKDNWPLENEVDEMITSREVNLMRIFPTSTLKDMIKAFREYKLARSKLDTLSNIKRDRNWYWLHKPKIKGGSGLSYKEIALKEWKGNVDKAQDQKNAVYKQVAQYKKRLSIKI